MSRERPTVRRVAAAATTVTVVALLAWLALARSGSSGAAAAPGPAQRAAAPAHNPLRAAALPASARYPVSGSVVERLPAGPYTYLRVRPAAGGDDVWLAMMAGSAPSGDRVDALVMGQKTDFHSRRLGRSFDVLLFAAATPPAASPVHKPVPPAKGSRP